MNHSDKQIADYGLIGDGETAALVARDATIEWLCMPRFDSEACFAALLGHEENGCWRMGSIDAVTGTRRRYLGDSLVLETIVQTDSGEAAIIDFMPPRGEAPDIVRIVECRKGALSMRSDLALRFDYGQVHPLVRRHGDDRVVAMAGPDGIVIDSDIAIQFEDRRFTSQFTLEKGERHWFVLTWFPSHERRPEPVDPDVALRQTRNFWHEWVSRIDYRGEYRHAVVRSLITLKALIHEPTGGIVAAPTASLPERLGGQRNWDYRFCWLRDSTMSLLALLQAGLTDEARSWLFWLRRAVGGEPIDLRPFYTVSGDRRVQEWEADWLPGFAQSRPVRFGNAAIEQLQLDSYGDVIGTLAAAARHGIEPNGDGDALVCLLADALEDKWEKPDAGIWESRGSPLHHVYSKAMAWLAFDQAAKWFDRRDDDRSRRYRHLASKVHAQVLDCGFDADLNSFVGAYGCKHLDAACLRLPAIGFLPADDSRIVGTIAATERDLMRDGMVRRYRTDEMRDGVGGDEGGFLAASFWLVDALALQGRRRDARAMFEHLCSLANDLGLLSEEVDGTMLLGNFPQALSHLSLVSAAMSLGRTGGPAHESGKGDARE
ncbi:glycoside hydrolase family 15 protein [Sphingobium sp. RSMS]|uniref:glycoside hydrolase family 15 protein n=1 Tax=Sphingobium sp. RSMS TaxID=520734 RepID=UPI0010F5FDAF|nr:glycoside hydrolase family 15 protein [Sphingobium sp. RSMS]UXC91476.1 glycoside hydrolase family 15 protein [Sphingobium sp. RSMS]